MLYSVNMRPNALSPCHRHRTNTLNFSKITCNSKNITRSRQITLILSCLKASPYFCVIDNIILQVQALSGHSKVYDKNSFIGINQRTNPEPVRLLPQLAYRSKVGIDVKFRAVCSRGIVANGCHCTSDLDASWFF